MKVSVIHGEQDCVHAESMTLAGKMNEDIIANAARIVAQRALYGSLKPTAKKEGGRG